MSNNITRYQVENSRQFHVYWIVNQSLVKNDKSEDGGVITNTTKVKRYSDFMRVFVIQKQELFSMKKKKKKTQPQRFNFLTQHTWIAFIEAALAFLIKEGYIANKDPSKEIDLYMKEGENDQRNYIIYDIVESFYALNKELKGNDHTTMINIPAFILAFYIVHDVKIRKHNYLESTLVDSINEKKPQARLENVKKKWNTVSKANSMRQEFELANLVMYIRWFLTRSENLHTVMRQVIQQLNLMDLNVNDCVAMLKEMGASNDSLKMNEKIYATPFSLEFSVNLPAFALAYHNVENSYPLNDDMLNDEDVVKYKKWIIKNKE